MNKLSPLEELKLEKVKLREECQIRQQKLQADLNYAKKNWGSLIFSTAFSSSKNGITGLITPFIGKKSTVKDKDKSSGLGSLLLSFTPLIWEIAQPMLIGVLMKKAKSLITGKKKNKKKTSDS